jgi:hypothetical protein
VLRSLFLHFSRYLLRFACISCINLSAITRRINYVSLYSFVHVYQIINQILRNFVDWQAPQVCKSVKPMEVYNEHTRI